MNYVEFRKKALENIGKVIKGKDAVIENVLITFLCSGHILLEDVPGTGKTMLLRALQTPSEAAPSVFNLLPTCCPAI